CRPRARAAAAAARTARCSPRAGRAPTGCVRAAGWSYLRALRRGSAAAPSRSIRATEAALASLERRHGLERVALPEIGPQRVGDPQLGVRELPEHEVREPHLAARPDQEIRIRQAGRVEVAREELVVDARGVELAPARVREDPAHG